MLFAVLKYLSSNNRILALFVSLLYLSSPLIATARSLDIILAQQPSTPADATRAAAQKAMQEAKQLLEQNTNAQSKQEAIAKYETALKLWQQLGDKASVAATLRDIGLAYILLSDSQKTLEYYNQALALQRSLKNKSAEAALLFSIAGIYSNLGKYQQALDTYNQALSIFKTLQDKVFVTRTAVEISTIYSKLGETKQALTSLNQALLFQRQTKDYAGEAETLYTIGNIYLRLGEAKLALEAFNQALLISKTQNYTYLQLLTLPNIGLVYNSLGENQKAIDTFNETLSAARNLKSYYLEAIALQGLASAYHALGESQKSLSFYEQALLIHRQVGNRTNEAETLNQIGLIYDSLGEKQKALDLFNQALALHQALELPARVAFTLNNIGGIYDQLGEKQKAIDAYNQAISVSEKLGDKAGVAAGLAYIAGVYSSLNDYQLSLNSYNQALTLFKSLGDRTSERQTLDKIGTVYRLQGDNQKALESAQAALSVAQAINNPLLEAATLTSIVRAYESTKDYQNALKSAMQVLSIGRKLESAFLQGVALAQMSRIYRLQGNYEQALQSINQAIPLLNQQSNRAAIAPALDNLARVHESLKQPEKAIATYNQSLALYQILGDRSSVAETLYTIATLESDRGNLQAALNQVEKTLLIVESLRSKVASQELRASYFATVQKYYQFYIDLLMQLHKKNPSQGYDSKALQASERARARSLLEILNEANADIRQGVDPNLLTQERNLQQQINTKAERQRQLVADNNDAQATAVKQEIDTLLRQYQEIQAQIRTKSPRYAALTQPQPLTLQQIQQQVLDDDTLLLEYSLGEERSYLWAISKTSISSYELPSRTEIETAVKNFRKILVSGSSRRYGNKEITTTTSTLSQILLQPVATQIGKKRLVIVADGALQYVPFTALYLPKNSEKADSYAPLVTAHEIVTLPSASTLAVLRNERKGHQPAPKTVAVLADPVFNIDDERVKGKQQGNPVKTNSTASILERATRDTNISLTRLPFTRIEAEKILALVPTQERVQVFDFAASRSMVTKTNLAEYKIVHFATHGILNSEHPELSGLVLSLIDEKGKPQNGFLRLHDIYNLNLPVQLVVLSACQTGLGQDIKGEGLVGLTRGFMYAGTGSVLVSLWSVDDEATAELMTRFYQGMLQKDLKPAAALRAAQVEMQQQTQWKAPYYWAGFVLQGEWK